MSLPGGVEQCHGKSASNLLKVVRDGLWSVTCFPMWDCPQVVVSPNIRQNIPPYSDIFKLSILTCCNVAILISVYSCSQLRRMPRGTRPVQGSGPQLDRSLGAAAYRGARSPYRCEEGRPGPRGATDLSSLTQRIADRHTHTHTSICIRTTHTYTIIHQVIYAYSRCIRLLGTLCCKDSLGFYFGFSQRR